MEGIIGDDGIAASDRPELPIGNNAQSDSATVHYVADTSARIDSVAVHLNVSQEEQKAAGPTSSLSNQP